MPLYLAQLPPEYVDVQLYAEAGGGQPRSIVSMHNAGAIAGAANGCFYTITIDNQRAIEDFTPRVIGAFDTVAVPAEAQFICWWSGQRVITTST